MPDAIAELLVTEAAIDKLGARRITTHDARQIARNDHVIVRNPHKASVDLTTWLIITGWDSSVRERKLLER